MKAPLNNMAITQIVFKNVLRTLSLLLAFMPAFAVAQQGTQQAGRQEARQGAASSATHAPAATSSAAQWGPKRNTTESAGPRQNTQQAGHQEAGNSLGSTAVTWGPKRNPTESAGPTSLSAAKDRSPKAVQEQPATERALSNRKAPSVGQHTGTPQTNAGGTAKPSVSEKPLFASSAETHATISPSKAHRKNSPSTMDSSKRKSGMNAGSHNSGVHRHAKSGLHNARKGRIRNAPF